MDLLQAYNDEEGSNDESGNQSSIEVDPQEKKNLILDLPKVDIAPQVAVFTGSEYRAAAMIDLKTKELVCNPKYDELFRPEVC